MSIVLGIYVCQVPTVLARPTWYEPQDRQDRQESQEIMQKEDPDKSAVLFKILPDCPLLGLSIYPGFSQSVTGIGLLATVSDRRRPEVSALPLGSKY
jgi:hypothetical protein